jgi:proteasome lid subunit RPN8/RPN11
MLILSRNLLDAIRAHAEQSYPEECCGVLLGQAAAGRRTVACALPCRNAAAGVSPRRYAIAPEELIGVVRQAEEQHLEIIGFYHSHPDHPATWSPTDLEEAHWLDCSYAILRVEAGRAAEMNSFVLAGCGESAKYFAPEPVAITEPSSLPPPPAVV